LILKDVSEENKFDPNATDSEGFTFLYYAISNYSLLNVNERLCQEIIRAGADPNKKFQNGMIP
jgi:hypothetical protein